MCINLHDTRGLLMCSLQLEVRGSLFFSLSYAAEEVAQDAMTTLKSKGAEIEASVIVGNVSCCDR
jgi:hypothetical protein